MDRRDFLRRGATAGALLPFLSLLKATTSPRPDVVVLSVDDLRPQLGCYGVGWMKTPHIDSLAADSTLFENAYCQQAVCLPSRASLWSGLRPDTIGITNLQGKIRKSLPDRDLIHQSFEKAGYRTVGMGKILHDERKKEWNEWVDVKKNFGIADYVSDEALEAVGAALAKAGEGEAAKGGEGPKIKWNATEAVDKPDEAFHDGMMTKVALERLEAHAKNPDKPLFLALGFLKPHLPFSAPKKYWDLYDRDALPLAPNPFPPKGMPDVAKTTWEELRAYRDMPKKGAMEEAKARELIHGYAACVSFLDAQVGKIVAKLKELGRYENTVILLFGDHGWKLGEHAMWAKHTDFEIDLNAPLLIKGPKGLGAGKRSSALVEFVDVFPTLGALAGLPRLPDGLEGRSLAPLMDEPARPWREYAFGQWEARGGTVMGYTLRNRRFRFTEWIRVGKNELEGMELYDHENDPREDENVAGKGEHAEAIREFRKALRKVFPKLAGSASSD